MSEKPKKATKKIRTKNNKPSIQKNPPPKAIHEQKKSYQKTKAAKSHKSIQ